MRGCFKIIVIGVGLVLILGAVVSLLLLSHTHVYLQDKIFESLQGAFKTPLKAEHIQLSPLEQKITITGLSIVNPPEFASGDAIYIPKVTIELAVNTFFGDAPVIKRIHVEGAEVRLRHEVGRGSNLATLAKLAEAGQSAATRIPDGRKFVVDEFVCENGKIKVSSNISPVALPEVPMPALTLRGEKGKPLDVTSLTASYLRAVLNQVGEQQAVKKSVVGELKDFLGLK